MTRRTLNRGRGLAAGLGVMLAVSSPAMGEDSAKDANAAPSPVRLDPDKLAGVDLPPSEPFISPEDVLEGGHRPRGSSSSRGSSS